MGMEGSGPWCGCLDHCHVVGSLGGAAACARTPSLLLSGRWWRR